MSAMYHAIDTWGKRFNKAVIGFVALDIVILALDLLHVLPENLSHIMHGITPWLVFLAAVLPAVVAGLNGVRFQSECQRLAERSAVMRVIMGGRSARPADGIDGGRFAAAERLLARMERNADNTPGSWSLDALRFTEKIANDFVQEVAEWSVLYAKEVAEP